MLNNTKDKKEREIQFHDKRYEDDQRKVLAPVYSFAEESKTFFEHIVTNIGSGDSVLELGCGTNTISKKIYEKGANVTIIDISEKAIEITKQDLLLTKMDANCLVMDAENLTFRDNSFDMIYGSGILHHLSLADAIYEIKRVLTPGGKAVFYEPLGHNFFINVFRKLTPNFRSVDEHPLLKSDLTLIKNIFPNTTLHYFYLFSLFTILFVKFPFMKGFSSFLIHIDKLLNRIFPFLKKYNWITIIEIRA